MRGVGQLVGTQVHEGRDAPSGELRRQAVGGTHLNLLIPFLVGRETNTIGRISHKVRHRHKVRRENGSHRFAAQGRKERKVMVGQKPQRVRRRADDDALLPICLRSAAVCPGKTRRPSIGSSSNLQEAMRTC